MKPLVLRVLTLTLTLFSTVVAGVQTGKGVELTKASPRTHQISSGIVPAITYPVKGLIDGYISSASSISPSYGPPFRPQRYGPPPPSRGISSYGAPLSQISPSGFSHSEPEYGVPVEVVDDDEGEFLGGPGGGWSSNGGGGGWGKPVALPPKQVFVDAVSASIDDSYHHQPNVIQASHPHQPEHVNIVFVKAPAAPQYETQVILPPPAQHDTKVYVLTNANQQHEHDVRIVSPKPQTPSKPEVFFIRYAPNAPKHPVSDFNRALDDIPPLPQSFDKYAPEYNNVKGNEIRSSGGYQ